MKNFTLLPMLVLLILHGITAFAIDLPKLPKSKITQTTTNYSFTSLSEISLCVGEKLALTAEDAGSGASYLWKKGSSTVSNTQDLVINNVTLSHAGIYTLTVTKNTCTNTAQIEVKINTAPATPTLTHTAATCANASSHRISNYDASVSYTFSPAGPTVNAGGNITGMVAGTNYTVKATKNTCESSNSSSFSASSKLVTPAIPLVTTNSATCSSKGSSAITNYDATVTYIFSPAGPSVATGGAISGMATGTNYTVKAQKLTCSSVASSTFSIAAQLPTPATPLLASTAATCTRNEIIKITNYDASLSYTFNPAGPTVSATGEVSGMTIGTNYTVKAVKSGCSSGTSTAFDQAAQLTTPAIPIINSTAATCSHDGTSSIQNFDAGTTYIFSPTGPSVGASGAISGMTVGTSYTVIAQKSTCQSNASSAFSNTGQLPAPKAIIKKK
ncbi:hypothetical protein TPENAI_20332 [Tenacibaculum litopenaei]|uniref:immunoglobulin domain-containing protein n=1 Tax=Tenacibaculum litopenaei TaxID=396016 RepID=UPI0038941401